MLKLNNRTAARMAKIKKTSNNKRRLDWVGNRLIIVSLSNADVARISYAGRNEEALRLFEYNGELIMLMIGKFLR